MTFIYNGNGNAISKLIIPSFRISNLNCKVPRSSFRLHPWMMLKRKFYLIILKGMAPVMRSSFKRPPEESRNILQMTLGWNCINYCYQSYMIKAKLLFKWSKEFKQSNPLDTAWGSFHFKEHFPCNATIISLSFIW